MEKNGVLIVNLKLLKQTTQEGHRIETSYTRSSPSCRVFLQKGILLLVKRYIALSPLLHPQSFQPLFSKTFFSIYVQVCE